MKTSKGHLSQKSASTANCYSENFNMPPILTTQSDAIPSAQVAPDYMRYPDAPLSLHSTGPLAQVVSAGGTQADEIQNEAEFSSQLPLREGRSKFQDRSQDQRGDIADGSQTPRQIRPFHKFYSPKHSQPNPPGASDKAQTKPTIPDSSQTNTTQKLHFGVPSDLAHLDRNRPLEGNAEIGVPTGPGTKDDRGSKSNAIPGHEIQPAALRRETSSLLSTGTPLPFILTASSTGTRHQDGQGVPPDYDDFDLSQAIADAGSFLQSWDVEREMSFQAKNNANPVSTSRTMQSMCAGVQEAGRS
jgi:hypothetical protein